MRVLRPGEFEFTEQSGIFLAGPSSRTAIYSTQWRYDAVQYLEGKFSGVVFVPEPFLGDYQEQIRWEDTMLHNAQVVVFWVPRDLKDLPGFTTNIEFGQWMNHPSKKPIVLGYPKYTPKMRYLHFKADQYKIPVFHTLEETLDRALCLAK